MVNLAFNFYVQNHYEDDECEVNTERDVYRTPQHLKTAAFVNGASDQIGIILPNVNGFHLLQWIVEALHRKVCLAATPWNNR